MTITDDFYSMDGQGNLDRQELLDTEFFQIRYTDVPGKFLAKYVFSQNEDPQDFFRSGIGVDGSSVRGFVSIDESDLLLLPDRSTLRRAPISNYKVATVIADVYWGFGRGRLARDPRYVCQRMEEHLAQEGLVSWVGPEVECFIFDDIVLGEGNPKIVSVEQSSQGKYPIRRKGGYDAPPFEDSLLEVRFEIAEMLKRNYLIKVTNLNHEVASSGQIEINFMHNTLTKAADNVQVYKDVVRDVAKKHGKVANFMPKPIFDQNDPRSSESDNGSGMHTSVSIWTKSGSEDSSSSSTRNIFYDRNDEYTELSQAGRYFIGGILNHVSSLTALVAPTVNSYYRLVPGFEAPVYAAWSKGNRSAIVRVPVNYRGNAESKRIEFRAPDPSANPYLAFSAILAAGMDGIKKKIDPGDSVNEDIYKMSDSARSSKGIKSLPGSLRESLQALKSDSDYLKPCFDGELIESYVSLKQSEISYVGDEGGSKLRQFMLYYDV